MSFRDLTRKILNYPKQSKVHKYVFQISNECVTYYSNIFCTISTIKVASKRSSKPMISDDEDEGVTGEVSDEMVVPKPKLDKNKEEDSDDEGPRQ